MFKNKTKDGMNNLCGKQIKKYRLQLPGNVSQRELAQRLCDLGYQIDKNAIQRIELGKRFVTDIELIYLVRVLGISYDDLFGIDDEDNCNVVNDSENGTDIEEYVELIHVDNSYQSLRNVLKNYVHYFEILNIPVRDREIINLFLDGMSYTELSKKYHLGTSRIRSIVVNFKMHISKAEREARNNK